MQIPDEGLKLVCVVGEIDGNPIWKQVGLLKKTARGGIVVYLDRIFNPAGVRTNAPGDINCALHAKEFTEEELSKRSNYKQDRKSKQKRPDPYERKPNQYADPFEDDIPF